MTPAKIYFVVSKSQKGLRANSYVYSSYRENTSRGILKIPKKGSTSLEFYNGDKWFSLTKNRPVSFLHRKY